MMTHLLKRAAVLLASLVSLAVAAAEAKPRTPAEFDAAFELPARNRDGAEQRAICAQHRGPGRGRHGRVRVHRSRPGLPRHGHLRVPVPSVPPCWPEDRYLELSPLFWTETRARLDAAELAAEVGWITVPDPIPLRRPGEESPTEDRA